MGWLCGGPSKQIFIQFHSKDPFEVISPCQCILYQAVMTWVTLLDKKMEHGRRASAPPWIQPTEVSKTHTLWIIWSFGFVRISDITQNGLAVIINATWKLWQINRTEPPLNILWFALCLWNDLYKYYSFPFPLFPSKELFISSDCFYNPLLVVCKKLKFCLKLGKCWCFMLLYQYPDINFNLY